MSGIVAVFIDECGRVIADASDFDTGIPAGFTQEEIHRVRAHKRLAVKVVNAYASTQLTRAMDESDCRSILQRLCRVHGCKIHEVSIDD